MCLGIPMQISSIDGLFARCEAKGVVREASLLMLEHAGVAVGDYVVVHLGYAVDKVSAEEAAAVWEIYDEMLAAEDAEARRVPPPGYDENRARRIPDLLLLSGDDRGEGNVYGARDDQYRINNK
jgi:hydrogenase expression/formation protein HypC